MGCDSDYELILPKEEIVVLYDDKKNINILKKNNFKKYYEGINGVKIVKRVSYEKR